MRLQGHLMVTISCDCNVSNVGATPASAHVAISEPWYWHDKGGAIQVYGDHVRNGGYFRPLAMGNTLYIAPGPHKPELFWCKHT